MLEILKPYLADIWLLQMAFFLLYYAVTDGLDLGVGIIALFTRDTVDQGTLMGSLKSNWHGNQTWLVILGGMLFGAFPVFYGVILSGLYIPIMVMLFGLVFRGIALELRDQSKRKRLWGTSFAWGSLIVSIAQGFALGGLLGGNLKVEHGDFVGGPWAWFETYSVLVTIGVLVGYPMLGANYLVMKTQGDLQNRAYRIAWTTSFITAGIAVAVHIWTALKFPYVAQRWTSFPGSLIIGGLALISAVLFILLLLSLKKRHENAPLFLNAALVVFSFAALSAGLYPNMIPNTFSEGVTVDEAAASPKTLLFMLYVSAVALPIVLLYTSYEYWVYRGKTSRGMEEEI